MLTKHASLLAWLILELFSMTYELKGLQLAD